MFPPLRLHNQGSQCYMLCFFQALFQSQNFRRVLLEEETTTTTTTNTTTSKEIRTLSSLLQPWLLPLANPTHLYSLAAVENWFCQTRPSLFQKGQQDDAYLFGFLCLELLEKENKNFGALVAWESENMVTCLSCHHQERTKETLWSLSVSLSSLPSDTPTTLAACCQEYFALEQVDDYICTSCTSPGIGQPRVRIARNRSLVQSAPLLLFHCKRFDMTGHKINQPVTFMTGMTVCDEDYHLIAIMSHYGSNLHSGHFVTFVRSSAVRSHWVCCDDNGKTTLVSETQLIMENRQVCLLWYERNGPKKIE